MYSCPSIKARKSSCIDVVGIREGTEGIAQSSGELIGLSLGGIRKSTKSKSVLKNRLHSRR